MLDPGWTASDLVGPASDIARLAYDVYAPPYKLVAKEYVFGLLPPESHVPVPLVEANPRA